MERLGKKRQLKWKKQIRNLFKTMSKIFYDIIPPRLDNVKIKVGDFKTSIVKIVVLLVIVSLNWAGISAVIETLAYLNDAEDSPQNVFSASTLDFSWDSPVDFSPEVTPTTTASRTVNVQNDGILGFQYTIQTANATGSLCGDLDLTADLDGSTVGTWSLTSFNYNAGQFVAPEDWQFTATLTSDGPALENETCDFDFVFDGAQIGGAGFYDQEIISNTITSGQWTVPPPPAGLKINEVYYDVLESKHCKEAKNEWVELYNPTDSPINLQKWEICHAYGKDATCNPINANVNIPALGFAAVGHDNSTWVHCFPSVPSVTIHQLGGPWPELGNDGDYIILKDPSGNIVDCVGWGDDPNTCNFLDGTVTDVSEGHSIARITKGYDTNHASDWIDLTTPNPGTNPHTTTIMVIPEIIEEDVGEEPIIEEEPPLEEVITEENQEQGGIIEEINEIIDEVIDEMVDAIMPDELTNEEISAEDTQIIDETAIIEEVPTTEEPVIEEVPIIEEQPVIAPDNNSGGESPPADSGGGDNGGSVDSGGFEEAATE